MKGLLISAFASAVLALGWSAMSTTPAQAYPRCITVGYYTYCISSYYRAPYCVYRNYYGQRYIYCRSGY